MSTWQMKDFFFWRVYSSNWLRLKLICVYLYVVLMNKKILTLEYIYSSEQDNIFKSSKTFRKKENHVSLFIQYRITGLYGSSVEKSGERDNAFAGVLLKGKYCTHTQVQFVYVLAGIRCCFSPNQRNSSAAPRATLSSLCSALLSGVLRQCSFAI